MKEKYEDFLKWVESTSLFNAIKNDPPGTVIEHFSPEYFSPELVFSLEKNAVKIERATDLPFEVLTQFLLNSPWSTDIHHWRTMYDAIMAKLSEIINKEKTLKQLPDAD